MQFLSNLFGGFSGSGAAASAVPKYTGGNMAGGGIFNATDFLGNVGINKSQMQGMAGIPNYPGGGGLPTSSMTPNMGQVLGAGQAGGFDFSKLAGGLLGMGGGDKQQQPAQQQGRGGSAIDPLYLLKQYAPQVADRYSPIVRAAQSRVPSIGGLLG